MNQGFNKRIRRKIVGNALASTFMIGLMVMFFFSSEAQQTKTLNDSSRVTNAAEKSTGSGKMEPGQKKYALRIPVGDRLDEVFAARSQWITGVTFRLAQEKDRVWGHWDDHHEQTHILKEKEYIIGVKVQRDKQVHWFELITNQQRILHFGLAKYGNQDIEQLEIPANSRVTGLTLYFAPGKIPELQRIEATYQLVAWSERAGD